MTARQGVAKTRIFTDKGTSPMLAIATCLELIAVVFSNVCFVDYLG